MKGVSMCNGGTCKQTCVMRNNTKLFARVHARNAHDDTFNYSFYKRGGQH